MPNSYYTVMLHNSPALDRKINAIKAVRLGSRLIHQNDPLGLREAKDLVNDARVCGSAVIGHVTVSYDADIFSKAKVDAFAALLTSMGYDARVEFHEPTVTVTLPISQARAAVAAIYANSNNITAIDAAVTIDRVSENVR